jgi:hypothetical protein
VSEDSANVLEVLQKIHGLLELLAEEKIAQRDAKQRAAMREIVGASATKQKSIFLMDGTRLQADIRKETSVNQGPKLAISIPLNFFESDGKAD